ncbi:MAG TPA: DUF1326 domain-containing protein [Candidatus Binatia bacterium]|nr:DUF1326 domain-containing protein [Candidatus Binatia bacterium]
MAASQTKWRMAGEEAVTCNCAWGCPCQFNAAPTTGNCQALAVHEVREGQYGNVPLAGVRFAQVVSWPGRLDQGDGTRLVVIDEKASREQREAIAALFGGEQGGAYFEIFAAICPHTAPPIFKPIEFTSDRGRRKATLRIADLVEFATDAIKNPVDGSEHRARIVLPNGFEYKEAEMGNALRMSAKAGDVLSFEYANTYAQLNTFDWTNG